MTPNWFVKGVVCVVLPMFGTVPANDLINAPSVESTPMNLELFEQIELIYGAVFNLINWSVFLSTGIDCVYQFLDKNW